MFRLQSPTVRTASLSAALLMSFVGPARSQSTNGVMTLDIGRAIEMALELNPNLRIAKANESIADAQIRQAAAGALPHVSLASSYTRNIKKPVFFFRLGEEVQKIEFGSTNAYIGNIEIRQTIFEKGEFGVRRARKVASLFSQATKEGTELTEDQVILAVRRTFNSVLLGQQIVEVFRESLDQAKAHFESVQKQYSEGMAAEFDLLRSEVEMAQARAALIEANNNLKLAKSRLKNSIGLPLDRDVNLSGVLEYKPIPEQDLSKLSQAGLQQRPEMRQLMFRLKMARLNTSIQKASRLPSLSLSSNYQFQGQSSDFQFGALERSTSFSTSLDLRFDIFTGFETSARLQQARAEANAILHQIETLEQNIRIEIQQAALRMEAARERIEAQQKSVHQAEKAHQIAEVRYDSGIGTQLELFDARLALNRIKTNYLQAIYDYNIAFFEWQKAVGIIQ